MMIPRLVAATALAVAVAVHVAAAPPATALLCVEAGEIIGRAEQVFAGRVIDAHEGRILVTVTEVWKGSPVEEQVWLDVESIASTAWDASDGAIPDGYSSPKSWVFAPRAGRVSACTAWAMEPPMDRHLALHRPDQPLAPVSAGSGEAADDGTTSDPGSASSTWSLVGGIGGVVVLTVVAVTVGLRRRRSSP